MSKPVFFAHKFLKSALLTLLACCSLAFANEPLLFDDAEQEARFNKLTLELRCLVCQNQNLADSDAPLAQDLRREIYDMIQTGRSDDEIKTFLVERYGDFVLYRPPVKGNTLMLWLAPAILLLIGGLVVYLTVRQRTRRFSTEKSGVQE
jgi:cytochrome c-type biogenesis protein CcmH